MISFSYMSNLVKLTGMSLVRVWPAVDLTSAGSPHGTLKLDVCVSVQFWSGRFSSPAQFGAVVFKHFPTLPALMFFSLLFSIPLI